MELKLNIDLHTHTIASDHAYSTIHDYIRQAVEKGYPLFACTDHGPELEDGPHVWHFNNLRVVPRVVEGVGILRGVEANITADGNIDVEDRILKKLDIVLAGFHPNYHPSTPEEHTRLMLKVIKSGKVDIIAHPGSAGYPLDYEQVLRCAKENGVAVEINSSSSVNTRMGSHENCVTIGKIATRLGNIISLGTDAHISYFMCNFDESFKVIAESGIRTEQIINTSMTKVLDFLESRGHPRIPELRALAEKVEHPQA